MKIEGTFHSETIGHTQKPAGWVGLGAVTIDETGLLLDGCKRGNGLISLLALAGFGLGIAGYVALGFDPDAVAYAALLGLFAGGGLGAALSKAKERQAHVPWKQIKKARFTANTFAFVSNASPKGQVTFIISAPSEAEDLKNSLAKANVKVKGL